MKKMKLAAGQIRLAATDLGNHLACRHLTTLDLEVAQGKRAEPDWAAPDLAVIRERGERHEREYLAHLGAKGLTVDTLRDRKSTRLNSSHGSISYAVFCLKKKKT